MRKLYHKACKISTKFNIFLYLWDFFGVINKTSMSFLCKNPLTSIKIRTRKKTVTQIKKAKINEVSWL